MLGATGASRWPIAASRRLGIVFRRVYGLACNVERKSCAVHCSQVLVPTFLPVSCFSKWSEPTPSSVSSCRFGIRALIVVEHGFDCAAVNTFGSQMRFDFSPGTASASETGRFGFRIGLIVYKASLEAFFDNGINHFGKIARIAVMVTAGFQNPAFQNMAQIVF